MGSKMKNFIGITILIILIAGCFSAVADEWKIKTLSRPAIQELTSKTNAGQRITIGYVHSSNPTNTIKIPLSFSGVLTLDFSDVPSELFRPQGVYKTPIIITYDGEDLNSTNDAETVCYILDSSGKTTLMLTKQRRIEAGQTETTPPDPEDVDSGEDAPAEEVDPPAPTVYQINLAWDAYDSATYTNVSSLTLYHTFGLSGAFQAIKTGISVSATNTAWTTTTTGGHQFALRGLKSDGTLTDYSNIATLTISE